MKHWMRRHRVFSVVLGLVAVFIVAGCAGEVSTSTSWPSSTSTPALPAPARLPTTAPRTAPAGSHHAAATAPALRRVHDPGQVTGSLSGPCHVRDDGQLPDPHCTPGAIDPAVTQADIHSTICLLGYTAKVRPPVAETDLFKSDQAYPAYGIPAGTSTELDHLVPLELGGANDATNLWPQAGTIPNPKDNVENTLRQAVCAGRVSLIRAQRAIARNWLTAESALGLGPGAASLPAPIAPTGCYPKTSSGKCYQPGEFCPAADHGQSGVAADGRAIKCVLYASGTWHWQAR